MLSTQKSSHPAPKRPIFSDEHVQSFHGDVERSLRQLLSKRAARTLTLALGRARWSFFGALNGAATAPEGDDWAWDTRPEKENVAIVEFLCFCKT